MTLGGGRWKKMSRTIPAGLTRVGDYRHLVAKDDTGALNSGLADASLIVFTVNNTSVRFSMGGTPTASTGILLASGLAPFVFDGYDGGSSNYLFAVGGTAQVSVSGFKRVGSGSKS